MKAFIDTRINWYVVRTNIKCEEKAFINLLRAGFRDVYLPRRIVDKINQRTHLRRRVTTPLMPRYLFLGLRHGDFGLARECEGVEYILSEEGRFGKPIIIPGLDIEEIFTSERELVFDDTKEAKDYRGERLENEFPAGAAVRVKIEHLMEGFEGRVHFTNRKDKVWVDINGRRVEFGAEEIERT